MLKVLVRDPIQKYLGTVFLLVGRGQSANDLISRYHEFAVLKNARLIALEPKYEWYPMPKGSNDQAEALKGLNETVVRLEKFFSEAIKKYNITKENCILSGFSAGAVMAIQMAVTSKESYAGVISHNGAILDPDALPVAKHKTPFLVFHSKDDDCFFWDERYIPMKNALLTQEYLSTFIEEEDGKHFLSSTHISTAGDWIEEIFSQF